MSVDDLGRPEDRVIFENWRRWLAAGGTRDVRADFYDALVEDLQDRVSLLVAAQMGQPPVPGDMLRHEVLDAMTRLRLRNLKHEIQELRFLLVDALDRDEAATYGLLINNATARIRRLQQAMNERSISGRRQREDAAVRVPFAEE